MAQNRKKAAYVDQFRKISTLQKLPPLPNIQFSDIFQERIKENNKFFRLKKEPTLNVKAAEKDEFILKNSVIEAITLDNQIQEKKQYERANEETTIKIKKYQQWSKMNRKNNGQSSSFKFFYGEASPPKEISPISMGKTAKNILNLHGEQNFGNLSHDINVIKEINQEQGYNFNEINKKRMIEEEQSPDIKLDYELEKEEEAIIQNSYKRYKQYQTLKQIMKINEYKMREQTFRYDLNYEPDYETDKLLMKTFIYNSIVASKRDLEVEYFRDLGAPSRDFSLYTEIMSLQKSHKDQIDEIDETKEQVHYLQLLKSPELNIEKACMNFYDLCNISTGRITYLNAYLCIRNDKPTRAELDKLLKRLERYSKLQKQKGRQGVIVISSGQTEEQVHVEYGEVKIQGTKQEIDIDIGNILEEIMQLKKQSHNILKNKDKNSFFIQDPEFKRELYTRMESLIMKVYEKIVNPVQYPLSQIKQNLSEISGIFQSQGMDKKVVWFIMDCYEQIIMNTPKQDNLKFILNKQKKPQPKIVKYKGNKKIKQIKIESKNLCTNRENRSRTPILDNMNKKSLTPTKKSHTPTKQTVRKNNTITQYGGKTTAKYQ